MRKILFVALFLFFYSPFLIFSDTIFLKDGVRLDVNNVKLDGEKYFYEMFGEIYSVDKEKVDHVESGEVPETPKNEVMEEPANEKRYHDIEKYSDSDSNSGNWYEGGTLHQSTVKEWNQAIYNNRLATSADWFVSITNTHNPHLKSQLSRLPDVKYLDALKTNATELEKCISGIVNDEKIAKDEQRVAEYVSLCYMSLFKDK